MNERDLVTRLSRDAPAWGAQTGWLRIGDADLQIDGLDVTLRRQLRRRWGPHLEESPGPQCHTRIRLRRGGRSVWLERAPTGEHYRLEVRLAAGRPVVVSYHFAIRRADDGDGWTVVLTEDSEEPLLRVLDNVMRYFAARMAVERGGLPLHAAGVLREGRAWLFAGPSRSGKSTAVALSAPARSLGDDMGIVWPHGPDWLAPALPFDNAERIDEQAPRGLFPVAGVWRLYQADEHAVERPRAGVAEASVMACAAFPWALPDLADPLHRAVRGLVSAGLFAHLRFRRDSGFWGVLE